MGRWGKSRLFLRWEEEEEEEEDGAASLPFPFRFSLPILLPDGGTEEEEEEEEEEAAHVQQGKEEEEERVRPQNNALPGFPLQQRVRREGRSESRLLHLLSLSCVRGGRTVPPFPPPSSSRHFYLRRSRQVRERKAWLLLLLLLFLGPFFIFPCTVLFGGEKRKNFFSKWV